MAMMRMLRIGATLAAMAVVGAACGSDDAEPAAETTSTTARPTTTTVDPQLIADEFDIGEGRTLYLTCRGTGSPTFLLEAGDEDDSGSYFRPIQELSEETRTCAYDRAGTGRSSAASGCRGMDDLIGDLERLLEVAKVDGPFIFVGASGGGYLAAEMATRHPDETAGLATFDTAKAITTFPPGVREEISCENPKPNAPTVATMFQSANCCA